MYYLSRIPRKNGTMCVSLMTVYVSEVVGLPCQQRTDFRSAKGRLSDIPSYLGRTPITIEGLSGQTNKLVSRQMKVSSVRKKLQTNDQFPSLRIAANSPDPRITSPYTPVIIPLFTPPITRTLSPSPFKSAVSTKATLGFLFPFPPLPSKQASTRLTYAQVVHPSRSVIQKFLRSGAVLSCMQS